MATRPGTTFRPATVPAAVSLKRRVGPEPRLGTPVETGPRLRPVRRNREARGSRVLPSRQPGAIHPRHSAPVARGAARAPRRQSSPPRQPLQETAPPAMRRSPVKGQRRRPRPPARRLTLPPLAPGPAPPRTSCHLTALSGRAWRARQPYPRRLPSSPLRPAGCSSWSSRGTLPQRLPTRRLRPRRW
jgi:hypothetical protein